MLKIYHNPRCKKSREGLAILENSDKDFEIIKYLDNPPSYMELAAIIGKLRVKPAELLRTQEKIWKENYKGKNLTDQEIIEVMTQHPKLIERPLVIKDNQAVIGRPPENIQNLLE